MKYASNYQQIYILHHLDLLVDSEIILHHYLSHKLLRLYILILQQLNINTILYCILLSNHGYSYHICSCNNHKHTCLYYKVYVHLLQYSNVLFIYQHHSHLILVNTSYHFNFYINTLLHHHYNIQILYISFLHLQIYSMLFLNNHLYISYFHMDGIIINLYISLSIYYMNKILDIYLYHILQRIQHLKYICNNHFLKCK